jgi:hypothetical protein
MPGPDPGHWLHRLTAGEWLAAAETELRHADEALGRRAVRPGVTHARRAAGMAWNAVLVGAPDERYGRSYMDHVNALAEDAAMPEPVRAAARTLRGTPAAPPGLVKLGRPDANMEPLAAARAIVAHARSRCQVGDNG